MTDHLTLAAVRRAARTLNMVAEPPREHRQFSLARFVSARAHDTLLDGVELEVCQQAARDSGLPLDITRPKLPLWTLADQTRADVVGTASAGGYLVETTVAKAVLDILRPFSIAARAGISILTGLVGNLNFARTTTASSGYWIASETGAPTEANQTLGQIALSPKEAGVWLRFSRLLKLQAADADFFIRRDIGNSLGALVDAALISGSGSAGVPLGILATPGIGTQAGASLAWTGAVAMKTALGNANALDDGTTAFISDPTTKGLLEGRAKAGGFDFIVAGDRCNGLPAYASKSVPSSTMILGKWSELLLAFWDVGYTFEITPFASQADFQTGIVNARCLVNLDVAALHPAAFVAATSIT
jgi:HK97 family phage major capsid protein